MAVAALAVLSGCATADGRGDAPAVPSTSQIIVETQADPWELPLEKRPDLFDPCSEIPVEAVEEALGGAKVEADDSLSNRRPGELLSCGWKSEEVLLGVLATWKSRADYLADPAYAVEDTAATVAGRPAIRATRASDRFSSSCRYFFFTSRGTAVVSLEMNSALNTYQGVNLTKGCDALDQVIDPLVDHFPEGDF